MFVTCYVLPEGRRRIDYGLSVWIMSMTPGRDILPLLNYMASLEDQELPERTRENLLFNLSNYVQRPFEEIVGEFDKIYYFGTPNKWYSEECSLIHALCHKDIEAHEALSGKPQEEIWKMAEERRQRQRKEAEEYYRNQRLNRSPQE